MAEYELALQGGLVTLTAWRGIGSHPVVPEGVQALGMTCLPDGASGP